MNKFLSGVVFAVMCFAATANAGVPMVSIVFHDGLPDPIVHGATVVLNATRSSTNPNGMKATFYVPTARIGSYGYLGAQWLRELAIMGNEVAPHGRTHADLTELSPAALLAEVQGSKSDLIKYGLNGAVQTFAYPFGAHNSTVDAVVRQYYVGAVGTDTDYDVNWGLDPYNLFSHSIVNATSLADITGWVATAKASGGWLILNIHHMNFPGDNWNMSTGLFNKMVMYLRDSGIRVRTVREGLCIYYNRGCSAVIVP